MVLISKLYVSNCAYLPPFGVSFMSRSLLQGELWTKVLDTEEHNLLSSLFALVSHELVFAKAVRRVIFRTFSYLQGSRYTLFYVVWK